MTLHGETTTTRETVLEEIRCERDRQIKKWGDRTHVDNARTAVEWSAILNEETGELAQAALHFHFSDGPADATLEGIYHEAIQVAAVATAIAEAAEHHAIETRTHPE